jgi:ribose transport system ATP-binding protein
MITGKPRKKQESCCCRIDQQSVSVEIENLQIKGMKKPIFLQVKRGEILGLAGLSGQGQEEFLAALAGYRKVLSGHIKINGQSAHLSSPRKAIKSGIALVPGDRQEEGIFMDHNIGDNLLFTMRTMSKTSFINKKKEDITRANDLIRRMNIQPQNPNQTIRYLSGGNQQKAVVGKWLELKPHLLLLSDPAKGVDVDAKEEMYRVIEQIAADGTAVILYASDNAELVRVCHRVAVM